MTIYTVILLMPDYLAEDYGADILHFSLTADTPDDAIGLAEILAAAGVKYDAPPEDFKAIAVLAGTPDFLPFNTGGPANTGPAWTGQLVCPACANTEKDNIFFYLEDIGCSRRVLGVNADGFIEIIGEYNTKGLDEDGKNPRFECSDCHHEFPLPAAKDAELEFVLG